MVKGINSLFMGYLMHFHAFAQPLDSKLPLAFGPQLLGLSFPFVWTFCWEKPDANRLPLPHNLRIPTKTGVSFVKSTAPPGKTEWPVAQFSDSICIKYKNIYFYFEIREKKLQILKWPFILAPSR